MTQQEKMAQDLIGRDSVNFNMAKDIEKEINNEHASKLNDKVDEYADRFQEHVKELQETADKLGVDFDKLEIKPIGNRILIKPFENNPFQRIKINKSGLITDLGGFAPEFKNTDNGKTEIAEQFIVTGAVQEIGPEVKWLLPGDVVFYRKDTVVPVPFFKTGFVMLAETQVMATVNEDLEKRFNAIKDNENGRK